MDNRLKRSGWLLWLAFGGLLGLIASAGVYGLSTIRTISGRNEQIRTDYLRRDRILQVLRANLYVSGTYIRDLLLEANPRAAESHRAEFRKARGQIDSAIAEYAGLIPPHDRNLFERFKSAEQSYVDRVDPTLAWTLIQRRTLGIEFTNNVLLPERAVIVQLADQLSLANARQLESGNRDVTRLFDRFNGNLLVYTVLSLLIGTLLAVITARRLLRLEQLTHHQLEEMQNLSSRLVEVQESERRAIARELHDEVGQAVSGILLGIGNVAATLTPADHTQSLAQLDDLRHLAERTVACVRNLSLLLRPSMLDDLGLVPALQWQAREVSRNANIAVELSADDLAESEISEETKTCIYRVVQEALTNVARHSRATNVDIRLARRADHILTLEIHDNGRGFKTREKGLGILGMEERVRHRNGTLKVESEPGRGTTLLIHLPA